MNDKVQQLEIQVGQVSADLASLKTETNETIKKTKIEEAAAKVKSTKEAITKEIETLKGLMDGASIESKARLEKMFTTLETLETSNADLAGLKEDISKNRIKRQRDGVTDKQEWKTNTLTNVARVAGGIGIAALTRKGVKWLFGIGKDKNEQKDKENNEEEKKSSSFGSKAWKFVKYAGLAVGGFFGVKWLVEKERYNDALDWLGIRKRPEAPKVTVDDTANTIVGGAAGMEYSADEGKTYKAYDVANPPTFAGDQKIIMRTAKTDNAAESKTTELIFTKNTDIQPIAPGTNPEQTTSLTPEELTKRNEAITKSIQNATSFPVMIEYGPDKEVLEAKGCPKSIDFDMSTQSIKLGNDQLKVTIGSFETQTSFGKAKVNAVSINSITCVDGKFILNVTGTGKIGIISKTSTQDVEFTKDKMLQIVKPYYEENKRNYDVSIVDKENNTIPISIEKIGGAPEQVPPANQPSAEITEYEKEFLTLDKRKQDQHTLIAKNTTEMYTNVFASTGKDRLPPLLRGTYDPTIAQFGTCPGSLIYLVDEVFPTVNDFIDDTFFDKVKDTTDLVLDTIAEFLMKFKDNTYFGSVIGNIADRLKGITHDTAEEIKEKLKNDPEAMKKAERLIKQISIVRFFVTEKKAVLQAKYIKEGMTSAEAEKQVEEKMDKVPMVGTTTTAASAYKTLSGSSILDSKMSTETTVGVAANAESQKLQEEIRKTSPEIDFGGKRGNIEFDYTKQTIKSWNQETEIEIDSNGVYRIKDLPLRFPNVKSLVRIANITNRFKYQYGSNAAERIKNNLPVVGTTFVRHDYVVKPGIFEASAPYMLDTERKLSKDAFIKYCPERGNDAAETYVAYLNGVVKSIV